MNDIATDRVGPMQNPPHLGELIRESMDDVGWNATDTAARFGCERGTLSRLLNGNAGISIVRCKDDFKYLPEANRYYAARTQEALDSITNPIR